MLSEASGVHLIALRRFIDSLSLGSVATSPHAAALIRIAVPISWAVDPLIATSSACVSTWCRALALYLEVRHWKSTA